MPANMMLDEENDDGSERLSRQALSFFMHVLIALGAWIAFFMVGYAVNTPMPQSLILALSVLFPLIAAYFVVRAKPDDMAGHVWLAGLIWLLVISLWILDMPTGPNACNQCTAVVKLSRTLFSLPSPSGLIDDNGPLYGTWPAAALFGYAIGAHLALRGLRRSS